MDYKNLMTSDPQLYAMMQKELGRQQDNLELIASENIVSESVLEASGSFLTNKYAEGYPGKRYYGGCEFIDEIEDLAIQRAKDLFGAEHANVQPHSGSSANFGVYFSMLEHGDAILGMDLSQGGHLTHGSPVNVSGKYFNFKPYGVKKEDERIDYDYLEKLAKTEKPKMIVAGASAYPREIDFKIIGKIAKDVGALFMVDMAHIAGLVAAGLHNNPCEVADFVTSTTHKTLRGPRGGLILCKEEYKAQLDKGIFPGIQGGPLEHIIAAKATCFKEALSDDFKSYQKQVVKNASALAQALTDQGYRLVSGGTDNHVMLVDVKQKGLTGKEAEKLLDAAHITVNKNSIPFDQESFFKTSGIRVGTPAVTTRGLKETDMAEIAELMDMILMRNQGEEAAKRVLDLTKKYPIYAQLGK